MDNLGAKEAADRIRNAFNSDRSARVDPEHAHQMKFAKEVCKELGADDSAETVQHVVTLLREHGVALHAGHEFPKFATRKWDRTSKIVHSEDEEHAWVDEAPLEPVDPKTVPARTLDAPVQDLSLDLKDKVPSHPETMKHPAGRAPDADTNAAASQRAIPETLGSAHAADEEHEVEDDDVHVEDVNVDEAHDEPEPAPEPRTASPGGHPPPAVTRALPRGSVSTGEC